MNSHRKMVAALLVINMLAAAACQGTSTAEKNSSAAPGRVQTSVDKNGTNGEAAAPTSSSAAGDLSTSASVKQQRAPEQLTASAQQQNRNGKGCQPASVPRTPGLASQFDMNELAPYPASVTETNDLLRNLFGDFEVETRYKRLHEEGDFNGDECGDIAVIVRLDKDHPNFIQSFADAAGNAPVDVTITNLRTGASVAPAGSEKRVAGLPADLRPQTALALAIIHGAPDRQIWAHGGAGRVFLLLDSVYEPTGKNNLISDVVPLNRKEESAKEPSVRKIPAEAKGDAILVWRYIKSPGPQPHPGDRKAIYFNGTNYAVKSLPDVNQ